MNPEQLSETIVDALASLVADGAITLPDGVPTQVTVERPRQKGHGDYSTNVALQLAKKASTNPRAFADLVAERLRAADGVAEVEVAGPGFLNVTVEAGAQGQVAADVVAAGAAYGRTGTLAGQSVNIEFISANPTGPLHLGHTRWAVLGDAIARVLQAAGAEVAREFYINDRGNQMDLFGASLEAAALGRPIPEDGYQGGYIADLAAAIVAERPDIVDLPEDERLPAFRDALDEAHELLVSLRLGDSVRRPTRELAYGQQRLLEIALALATRPRVLLLDEPAAGVPREESGGLFRALAGLSQDLTVLFIEHDMSVVFQFASRVVVMVGGRILVEGSPAEIGADPRVREIYLGRARHG